MSENDSDIVDAEIVELPNLPALTEDGHASIDSGMDREPEGQKEPAASLWDGAYLPDDDEAQRAARAKQDVVLAANAERRCVAHKRNGEQCRKFAIHGATVCRTHGGATKHVANAARIRVQMASDRLVSKLIEFAFDDTKPPDTQLRAIRDALDRAGMQPKTEVEIGVAKPFEQVFDAIGGSPTRDYDAEQSLPPAMAGPRHESDSSSRQPGRGDSAMLDELRRSSNRTGLGSDATGQFASSSRGGPRVEGDASAREAGGDELDRERQPQDAGPHITGMAAIRIANAANAQIGALRPPKELESPHKRYRNPYDV